MSDTTPQNNPPPKKIPPEIIQEAMRRFRCESLGRAISAENMEALTFLLQNGADPNQPWSEYDPPPIIYAARYCYFEAVEILIKYHANIDIRGRYNQTPLIAVAKDDVPFDLPQVREKCVTMAKFLLDNGANIEAKDNCGRTPLILAVTNGNIQMTQLFLENGANIEAKDDSGRTPLIWAVMNCNIPMTQFLLDNGANIEAKDNSGRTPLIWAVIRYNEQTIKYGQIIKLLLKHGANQNVSDNSGKTPIQIATENNRQDLIDLLNDYTSQTTSTAHNSPPPAPLAVGIPGEADPVSLGMTASDSHNQALPLEREGGPVANTTGDRMKREHTSPPSASAEWCFSPSSQSDEVPSDSDTPPKDPRSGNDVAGVVDGEDPGGNRDVSSASADEYRAEATPRQSGGEADPVGSGMTASDSKDQSLLPSSIPSLHTSPPSASAEWCFGSSLAALPPMKKGTRLRERCGHKKCQKSAKQLRNRVSPSKKSAKQLRNRVSPHKKYIDDDDNSEFKDDLEVVTPDYTVRGNSEGKSAKQLRNRVSPHKKTKFYIDDDGNPISASEKRNLEAKIRRDETEGRYADIFFGRIQRVRTYGKPPEDESITPNEIFPHEFRIFCFPRRKRTKLPLPKKPRGLTPPLPKKPPPLKKRIPKIYYSNGYFRVRKKQGRYTIKIMPPTEKQQLNAGIKLMKMHAREMLRDGRLDDLYRSGLCAFLTPEEIQRGKNRIVKKLMDEYRADSRRRHRLAEKRYRQQQKEEQKRQQQKPPPQLPPPNNPDAP